MAKKEVGSQEGLQQDPMWLDRRPRDLGFQNNWEVPDSIKSRYLRAMSDSRAHRANLGFRKWTHHPTENPPDSHQTAFWNRSLSPSGLKIGVTVNVADLTGSTDEVISKLETLFSKASILHLRLVQLAAHIAPLRLPVNATGWLSQSNKPRSESRKGQANHSGAGT